jgi:ribosomal protein S18 acetylase RimI-like enzyme
VGVRLGSFRPGYDDEALITLQRAYAAACPGVAVLPPTTYAGPGFDRGRHVLCARDASGRLLGYAPLLVPDGEPEGGETILWTAFLVDPDVSPAMRVLEFLHEALLAHATALPRDKIAQQQCLQTDVLPSEELVQCFLRGQGWSEGYRIYDMSRDLAQPLVDAPCPAGVRVRLSDLRAEGDAACYLQERNGCFPTALWSADSLAHLLRVAVWPSGMGVMTAWADEDLVGAVMLYRDPEEPQRVGYTEDIFCVPQWRNRGVASHLIVRSLEHLQGQGLLEARLQVSAENPSALGLYRRLGYVVREEKVVLMRGL